MRSASAAHGHRPAITVLGPERREEQGFASLAQWAAKGAHLFELDLGLSPRDRLLVSGPAAWLPAAVCLAAWWAGITVVTEATVADASVLHERSGLEPVGETLWFGDAVDGVPLDPERSPAYAVEVQAFPDHPPDPRAASGLPALETPAGEWTQRALVERARSWGEEGTLGVEGAAPPDIWVPAVAVRPLLVGRPTVVLRDGDRDAAAGEKVSRWV